VPTVKKTACDNDDQDRGDRGDGALTPARQRRARRHDQRLIAIARTAYHRTPRCFLRGAGRQCAQRGVERTARRGVLARVRWAGWNGWSRGRCARALRLTTATLAEWWRRWDDPTDRLKPSPLGARPLTCSAASRTDVTLFLTLHGTAFGVATLQDHFPALSRRDLACLLHLTRMEVDHVAAGGYYHCITWFGAGRVWALDHTEPPMPIENRYRWVLTVRDLASGCTLAATAVESPDAQSTIDVLRTLCAQHGPPLLLKADNGPAFTSWETRAFLDEHGIELLLSPAYTPTYNGACEAGNGTIKHLMHQIACRHDRPEIWSLDDLEAARLLANHRITDRDQTFTPEERFAVRTSITGDERHRFAMAIAGERERRTADSEIASARGARRMAADALERQAIAAALLGTGVITIRSRRVRLSYSKHKEW